MTEILQAKIKQLVAVINSRAPKCEVDGMVMSLTPVWFTCPLCHRTCEFDVADQKYSQLVSERLKSP